LIERTILSRGQPGKEASRIPIQQDTLTHSAERGSHATEIDCSNPLHGLQILDRRPNTLGTSQGPKL